MKISFQLNPRITNFAARFAIFMGVAKVIGIFSRIWIFTYLANTFAIGPAPSPYDRVSTLDPYDVSSGFSFGCEGPGGTITWHPWNHLVRGEIPGPHRRGVTLLSYFSGVGSYISQDIPSRMDGLTQYYFCKNGPITRAAGCPDKLNAILFRNSYKGRAVGSKRVACIP